MTIPSHAELLREYLEQLSQPGAESRLPAWRDWVRLRGVSGAMAIGAALALVGCDDSDTGSGNGNIAGNAGMQSTTGSGGMNMTALYAAPMTGGTGATTTTTTGSGGIGNVTALYGVPMTGGTGATTEGDGGASAGGMTAGLRYAVPLGGSGGQSVAQGGAGAATATGGTSMVALYMAPMEKSIPPLGSEGS